MKPRLRIKIEWRDWWIGVYIADDAIYVCLLPCLPIIWTRSVKPHNPMNEGS